MLAARTDEREHALARDLPRGVPAWCPACGAPVTLKRGRIVTPHFAHAARSECTHGAGETAAHRLCKYAIADALASELGPAGDVVLERPLPGLRPDVSYTHRGADIAIEVQRSVLSVDEIARRTAAYTAMDVHVLWVSPHPAGEAGERYAPKAWERWCHALHFGRVYHWAGGAIVTPVHLAPWMLWVEASEWYGPGGVEESAGGYEYRSKRWRSLEPHAPVALTSMAPVRRRPWRDVPAALILAAK